MSPLVSILMPAYNAEKWIAAAIQSALRQTWEKTEVIVVDDGSTDRTLEVAKSFEAEGVMVVEQRNQGGCVARNRALEISRGDYIQWLDADDLLAPDKIERQLRAVSVGEGRVLLSAEFGRFYHRHHPAIFAPTDLWATMKPVDWLCKKLGENLWMANHSWLVSRELSDAAGPWDESLRKDQDGEYACRLMLHAQEVRFVSESKCYYRTSGFGSVSQLGNSAGKLKSQLQSLKICIGYLQSLEDSERTRKVAVNLLNDWAHHYYPHHRELLSEMELLAQENGGEILEPRLPPKYRLLQAALGFARGRSVVQRYNRLKTVVKMSQDQVGYSIERLFGSARLAFSVAESFQKGSPEVVLIPFDSGNPYQGMLSEKLEERGYAVIKRRWLKGLRDEFLQFGLRERVVHLHWLPSFSVGVKGWWRLAVHLARLLALRRVGARIVWTVHNLYSHERNSRLMERVLNKFVMRIADRIIVHSPTVITTIEEEFGFSQAEKIEVIPHGNYCAYYPNEVSKIVARETLGVAKEGLGILFFGNLRPYKGVGQLLSAYRDIARDENFLVIAGRPLNDEYLEKLEGEASSDERVRLFPGVVENDDIQIYMNSCEVVVFPYKQVLTSGAVVLAMSFGKACVAPRLGCIPDILDEEGAFLYDPEDPQGLKQALSRAVAERERLDGMGAHNLRKAKEWGWGDIAEKTAEVYEKVLCDRGSEVRSSELVTGK